MPLKTELEYIRLYLQIEQTRLQDRLEVEFAIDPLALDAAAPNLILLPLIESAIANGVSVRPGRARVSIRARAGQDTLLLEVGEAAADPAEVPSSVPIDDSFVRKTKLLLELLYPLRHEVGISDRLDKGHDVRITLPLSEIADARSPAEERRDAPARRSAGLGARRVDARGTLPRRGPVLSDPFQLQR